MNEVLHVAGWHEPLAELIEVDPYVPLKITWGKWDPNEPYRYWRTGNLKTSFIEFRLLQQTGLLRSVTLLMANDGAAPTSTTSLDVQHVGVPRIDMNNWADGKYLDVPGQLGVSVKNDVMFIWWSDNEPVTRVKSGGRVEFGLDADGCLVSLSYSPDTDGREEPS